jgi:hypothetical protein
MSNTTSDQSAASVAGHRVDLDPGSSSPELWDPVTGLPKSYKRELDPTSAMGEHRLLQAGFTLDPKSRNYTPITREQAHEFLVEYDRRHPAQPAPAAPPQAAAAKAKLGRNSSAPQVGKKRRGRPGRCEQVPQVFNNRSLERCLSRIHLTRSELKCARNILSALRSQYVKDKRGTILNRNNLGSRSVVARAINKLRAAGLITDTKRIAGSAHGNATPGITNLGPAFFNLSQLVEPAPKALSAGSERGSATEPALSHFSHHQTPSKHSLSDAKLNPRFRNPLKEGSYGAGPLASAHLRAAAISPAPQVHQQKDISSTFAVDQSELSIVDGLPTPCDRFTPGDALLYNERRFWFVTYCPSTSACVLIGDINDKPCVVSLVPLRLSATKL